MSREQLVRGRDALQRRAWGEAFQQLSAADRATPLEADDIEVLAEVAYLLGRQAECQDLLGRGHQAFLAAGNAAGASRCAFRLGIHLLFRNDRAQGTGWLARARRVLDDANLDCVERGYLLIPEGIMAVQRGDGDAAWVKFSEAVDIGTRFKDKDLRTWAMLGQGRALLRRGDNARGLALLDEAMVAVTADEVSASLAGHVYCSVIDGCYEVFDLRRAHEWTAALTSWCESQPDLQPHRGDCLVRRAEVMQLHGEWQAASESAAEASRQLSEPELMPSAGAAFYRQAELYRLRGEIDKAKDGYDRASDAGRQPEPGHALLRLAQGETALALASIKRAGDETKGRNRPPMLAALVEIALAAGDVSAAQAAAQELDSIAQHYGSPYLEAHAAHAAGAVALAEGRTREALAHLRKADDTWRELGAPYEWAQVRTLLSQACRAQGDSDAADLELAAARRTFEQLGARPDLARLDALAKPAAKAGALPGGLSEREKEVLIQVASGRTNKAIAAALKISEKTVARHVANIFTKINVSSRSAATAWAFKNGLVRQ